VKFFTVTKILFFRLCFFLFLFPCLASAKPIVVLDAAHGGADSGVKVGSEIEKDWDLKFAQALEKALQGAGFEVVEIRKRDETITPDKRAEMINTAQGSAVLILHMDRDGFGSQKGPQLVVEPPTQGAETTEIPRWGAITPFQFRTSLKLARAIASRLGMEAQLSSLSDSRGSSGESLSPTSRLFCLPHESLRYLNSPAVVLTPLFLSSASDLKKFSSADAISEFATKVSLALADFLQ